MTIRVVAVTIVVAVAIAIAATLFLSGRPMKLIAVCMGEGTQSVQCTWIPEDASKRTAAEQELFNDKEQN
jgi:hypothetical protein